MSEDEKSKRQALEDEVRDMRLELQIATQLQGLSSAHQKNTTAHKLESSNSTNFQGTQQKKSSQSLSQSPNMQPQKVQHNSPPLNTVNTSVQDEPRKSLRTTPTKPTPQPKAGVKSRRNSKSSEPATPPQRATPTRTTKSPIPPNNPPSKTKPISKEKPKGDVPVIKLHSKMFASVKQQE